MCRNLTFAPTKLRWIKVKSLVHYCFENWFHFYITGWRSTTRFKIRSFEESIGGQWRHQAERSQSCTSTVSGGVIICSTSPHHYADGDEERGARRCGGGRFLRDFLEGNENFLQFSSLYSEIPKSNIAYFSVKFRLFGDEVVYKTVWKNHEFICQGQVSRFLFRTPGSCWLSLSN